MAEYVPPALYTIPPACPLARDGILCAYNDVTEYVADFSGWPWIWNFGWDFPWVPDAIVLDRPPPDTQTSAYAPKSPRGEPRSEPRSQTRIQPRSAAQDERPYEAP
jgi:hypothetical protein